MQRRETEAPHRGAQRRGALGEDSVADDIELHDPWPAIPRVDREDAADAHRCRPKVRHREADRANECRGVRGGDPVDRHVKRIDHFAAECGAHALQKPRSPRGERLRRCDQHADISNGRATRGGVFDPLLLPRLQKLVAVLAEHDIRHIDFGEIVDPPADYDPGDYAERYGGVPVIANYLFFPEPTAIVTTTILT